MSYNENNSNKNAVPAANIDIDLSNYIHVFSACLGKMMAIQNAFAELVVKNRNWNVDFSRGIIAFSDGDNRNEYPLQFLGSESNSSQTWLWGWENVNNFPDALIGMARYIREIGEKWGLEPLTVAEFDLNDAFNGHNLSIIACGLSKNYCYYRCPHANGAAFVAVTRVDEKVFAPVTCHAFASITTQCIQQFPVDHRIFTESFLSWNGTPYEWSDNKIIAHFEDDLCIEFERVENFIRICSIKTVLKPETI